MRGLTLAQKRELTRMHNEKPQAIGLEGWFHPADIRYVRSMNDYETFYQDADRFLGDLYWEDRNKRDFTLTS